MPSFLKFPQNFVWGTAISAYQTEGHDGNTDWWEWEKKGNKYSTRNGAFCDIRKTPECEFPLEQSGIACDSYTRYEEDFDLCAKLNNKAIRFSIEWARIEPQEGVFDEHEIAHYKKVLKAAHARGLKTFVTLHHFTNPRWFAAKKSWENPKAPFYFARYAKKCAQEFDGLIDFYMTINEPQVLALMGYVSGIWPPNKKNLLASLIVQINMIRAHKRAYAAIKSMGSSPVGIAKNIAWFEAHPEGKNVLDKVLSSFLFFLNEALFLNPIKNHLDFIGLNYYFAHWYKNLKIENRDDFNSDLNWWIYPEGLTKVLLALKRYDLPIYITENGVADAADLYRTRFLRAMLFACFEAIEKDVDLRGYFYWSLIDNFEWHQGFWPRFGLVEIDRENNLARKPRPSFYTYAEICNQNGFAF